MMHTLRINGTDKPATLVGTSARTVIVVVVHKEKPSAKLGINLTTDREGGVKIKSLEPGLPGAAALLVGDIIGEINDFHPKDHHDASQQLRTLQGDITLKVLRIAVLSEVYDLQEKLGEGAFGTVHRATNKMDGMPVAVKSVAVVFDNDDVSKENRKMLKREVEILREVKHPCTVRLIDTFEPPGNNVLYLAMELCEGGDLEHAVQLRKRLEEEEAANVMRQNIMIVEKDGVDSLTTAHVKLVDFGLGRTLPRHRKSRNSRKSSSKSSSKSARSSFSSASYRSKRRTSARGSSTQGASYTETGWQLATHHEDAKADSTDAAAPTAASMAEEVAEEPAASSDGASAVPATSLEGDGAGSTSSGMAKVTWQKRWTSSHKLTKSATSAAAEGTAEGGRGGRVSIVRLERDVLVELSEVGTMQYCAPGLDQQTKAYLAIQVDIYSLGATLQHLLCGRSPKPADLDCLTMMVLCTCTWSEQALLDELGDAARQLIVAMKAHDPHERPTAKDALDHPFFKQYPFKTNGTGSS